MRYFLYELKKEKNYSYIIKPAWEAAFKEIRKKYIGESLLNDLSDFYENYTYRINDNMIL